tara:strand:- start:164 stop:691 length:528 start_codon:yes stop_codon:yes gene_type:complete
MAHFDLSLYETVAQRLERWWIAFPNGRIITSIHHYDGTTVIMRAECFNNEDKLISTGYAEEVFGSSNVNKTSYIENCETSCIGRAISNSCIGHTGERASSTEMEKVNRVNSAPAPDAFGGASAKQIGFLKSLARGKAWDDFQLLEFIHQTLGVDDAVLETLSSGQCSKVIERMKL